ncbi:MAG: hypothetical protein QW548_00850 [Candidatus Aenigmatarchaeota archaeon]
MEGTGSGSESQQSWEQCYDTQMQAGLRALVKQAVAEGVAAYLAAQAPAAFKEFLSSTEGTAAIADVAARILSNEVGPALERYFASPEGAAAVERVAESVVNRMRGDAIYGKIFDQPDAGESQPPSQLPSEEAMRGIVAGYVEGIIVEKFIEEQREKNKLYDTALQIVNAYLGSQPPDAQGQDTRSYVPGTVWYEISLLRQQLDEMQRPKTAASVPAVKAKLPWYAKAACVLGLLGGLAGASVAYREYAKPPAPISAVTWDDVDKLEKRLREMIDGRLPKSEFAGSFDNLTKRLDKLNAELSDFPDESGNPMGLKDYLKKLKDSLKSLEGSFTDYRKDEIKKEEARKTSGEDVAKAIKEIRDKLARYDPADAAKLRKEFDDFVKAYNSAMSALNARYAALEAAAAAQTGKQSTPETFQQWLERKAAEYRRLTEEGKRLEAGKVLDEVTEAMKTQSKN